MTIGYKVRRTWFAGALGVVFAAVSGSCPAWADSTVRPIVVGLDADMSAGTRPAGEALRRGIILALKEINRAGGVLNRPMQLEIRDHRSNPARGIDNMEDLAQIEDLVAVIGGAHTPTAIATLDTVHRLQIPYLIPWAAGTRIVQNGRTPNFVFRVSAPDDMVGPYLIRAATERGFKRPGLLLWNTAWGRSNEEAMIGALEERGLKAAGIEWFNTSESNMTDQIRRLIERGADVVMLVAGPRDGAVAVQSMARMDAAERLPIISHWGIALGNFYELTANILPDVDLSFLQTFSFVRPPVPARAQRLYDAYCAEFKDCDKPELLPVPGAIAHVYDLVHLLAKAVKKAGSTDREKIRVAFENLGRHDGIMRRYDPPFTEERHDALDTSSFILCRFGPNGAILPIPAADG